jgi:hypothetical protein
VIDGEEQPAADLAREGHDAVVGGDHHRADAGGDVDPTVPGTVRIVGQVEAADDGSRDRPRPRDRRAGTDRWRSDNREHSEDRAEPTHRAEATGDDRADP